MGIVDAVEAFSAKNPDARASLTEDRLGFVVGVSGSLELKVSYELQELLLLVIDGIDSGKRLAIDLAEVTYISSTGIGALINTLVSARKRDVGIVFHRVPSKVLAVLEVLGLASFFPIEEADD